MKKLAILFSAIALAFAVTTVDAQNVPEKKPSKKVENAKSKPSSPTVIKKDKKDCCTGQETGKAKSDCATPCSDDKSKSAKPVPASK